MNDLTTYRIYLGATNRPEIDLVHDGMDLGEAMKLLPEGESLRIMEGVNGSVLFGVPDTRLQAIANAWNGYTKETRRSEDCVVIWNGTELAALLDALVEREPL